jgi:hypothetical protein
LPSGANDQASEESESPTVKVEISNNVQRPTRSGRNQLESCAFLANAAQVGGAISIACRVELHTA